MEVRFICKTCKKQVINRIHPNYPYIIEAILDLYVRGTKYCSKHQEHDTEIVVSRKKDCWEVTEEDL